MARIPKCPVENLNRVKSILSHWEDKLEHLIKERRQTFARLEEVEEKIKRVEEMKSSDMLTPEMEEELANCQSKARKFRFAIYGGPSYNGLNREIRTLRGQIKWSKKRQIPFLESEVARLEMEKIVEENPGETAI